MKHILLILKFPPPPLTHSIIEFKHLLCWYVLEDTKRFKRPHEVISTV
jgi:hypothetical protein